MLIVNGWCLMVGDKVSKAYTLVFDIGKTHVKLQVLDANLVPIADAKGKNEVSHKAPYPQADVNGIWQWFTSSLKNWDVTEHIAAIVVTTHGATAALISNSVEHDNGLVLPVLDYEYGEINDFAQQYSKLRPTFSESCSPALPAGLNLGRQLYWQSQSYPADFAQVSHILMYPQYWAWRLTGVCSTEVSSLGCHTDLWAPDLKDYSSLVGKLQWRELLGELSPAWAQIGTVQAKVAAQTGLKADCKVYAGVHDSNASYLRYLRSQNNQPFTVVSSGTWTIMMSSGSPVAALDEHKDMLANVDVQGNPVACARFMGGREYETICATLAGECEQDNSAQALQYVLAQQYMVTPDFSGGNGPFGGLIPVIKAPAKSEYAGAIATLYCALMIDYQLSQLNAQGAIFIEGAFLQNPLMCQLIAQLRLGQTVYLSTDGSGTVQGAALLSRWQDKQGDIEHTCCEASQFEELLAYKQHWLAMINNEVA